MDYRYTCCSKNNNHQIDGESVFYPGFLFPGELDKTPLGIYPADENFVIFIKKECFLKYVLLIESTGICSQSNVLSS